MAVLHRHKRANVTRPAIAKKLGVKASDVRSWAAAAVEYAALRYGVNVTACRTIELGERDLVVELKFKVV